MSAQTHCEYSLRSLSEQLLLTKDIKAYHFVSQGRTEIEGVDDGAEFRITDVSLSDQLATTLASDRSFV